VNLTGVAGGEFSAGRNSPPPIRSTTPPKTVRSTILYTVPWKHGGEKIQHDCSMATVACGLRARVDFPIGVQIVGRRFRDLGVPQWQGVRRGLRGPQRQWTSPDEETNVRDGLSPLRKTQQWGNARSLMGIAALHHTCRGSWDCQEWAFVEFGGG